MGMGKKTVKIVQGSKFKVQGSREKPQVTHHKVLVFNLELS
jgi:hypothetical protein